jgi:hypothetical protein
VKVSVGDPQYATTNTINVNGVSFMNGAGLAINAYSVVSKVITVTNGRIVMDNGASADLTTRVNFLEIAPYFATTKINFQLAGSPTVAGYQQDNGLAYADRGNGLTYGWNFDNSATARDRNKNADQLLDTVVQFRTGSTWAIALPNGTYSVKVSVGDSQYASNYTLNANGQNVFNNVALGANQFQQKTVTVTVSNGKLTLDQGNAADMATRINYIEITQV